MMQNAQIRARSDLRQVVGPSKQASKQANIHTHGCNEVTLVWGSLRLAPIIPLKANCMSGKVL